MRTVLQLPRALRTLLLLQAAYCGLRLLPYRKFERLFLPEVSCPSDELLQQPEVQALAARNVALLDSVSWRFPWLSTCLVRSLVLCRLLRQDKIGAEVHFGARPQAEAAAGIEAHAWVEDIFGNRYDRPGAESELFQPLVAKR